MKRETILLMQRELERAFRYFNKAFYNSELPPAVITIQSGKNTLGWYAPERWLRADSSSALDEINIAAEALDKAERHEGNRFPSVIVTLLHEMVHLYNTRIAKVIDVYENGHHKKKQFGHTAEKKGLVCRYLDKYPGVETPGLSEEGLRHFEKLKFRTELFNRCRAETFTYDSGPAVTGKKKKSITEEHENKNESGFAEKLKKVYGKKKSVLKRKSLYCPQDGYSVSVAAGFSHELKCMSCGNILRSGKDAD